MTPRGTRFTEVEMLAGLRRYAEKVGGRAFTTTEFDAWEARPFCSSSVFIRFGSWRAALRAIGIEIGWARRFEAGALIDELERVCRELGQAPSAAYLSHVGKYPSSAYTNRWGSLRGLCQRIALHWRGEITREELVNGGRLDVLRKGMSDRLRLAVMKRDGFRCVLCGKSPATERGVVLHVDHVRAVGRGGRTEMGNLRTLCRGCNLGRREYGRGVGRDGDSPAQGAEGPKRRSPVAEATGNGRAPRRRKPRPMRESRSVRV